MTYTSTAAFIKWPFTNHLSPAAFGLLLGSEYGNAFKLLLWKSQEEFQSGLVQRCSLTDKNLLPSVCVSEPEAFQGLLRLNNPALASNSGIR